MFNRLELQVFFCLSLIIPPTVFADDAIHRHWQYDHSFEVLFTWDSRYVTEGRDILDEAGVQKSAIHFEYGPFFIDSLNVWGYDSNYDELNIIPGIQFEIDDYTIYLSYNRKIFFVEDVVDNEIEIGVTYEELPYDMFTAIVWYHSFLTDGAFLEFTLGSEIYISKKLEIEPVVVLGVNNNYIPDGHDGLNHVSLELNTEYQLAGPLELIAFARYNKSINSDPVEHPGDELLKDFFWGGIGIEFAF
ncbi:MAG: hypothetical protein GWO08_05105 [Gammaproteobacteria bacterium]|nr:hypothetical protein [Gammaproteobacteria bacterium]NIN62156.1 hypothetical protein [Gammaproteobacteria bacterium]NIO61894.1 hypothetical protein [Gammaproteobacteria bacterium]NIP49048.1 hypothetical protein [Gammaproteobacteria bacterium]NIQ09504.1 hypothetical protein [Gammaproteobacteria bacterium]